MNARRTNEEIPTHCVTLKIHLAGNFENCFVMFSSLGCNTSDAVLVIKINVVSWGSVFLSSHGSDSLEGLPLLKVCFSIFVFVVIFVYFSSHTAGSQLKTVFTNAAAKGNAKD